MISKPGSYLQRGLELVETAETGFRTLLMEAAKDGDYDSIGRITAWAKQIRSIIKTQDGVGETSMPIPSQRLRQPIPKDYPRYYKVENKLIMVGWQKKTQVEYEHKVPRMALEQLVRSLLQGSSEKQPIETDALLVSLKFENGESMPNYYGWTFLRWLRSVDLVEKHGHGGYSVKKRATFIDDMKNCWERLPLKN